MAPKVETWPAEVADSCPPRRILPECFRRDAITTAMADLSEKFGECFGPETTPFLVTLTIETRGGAASCVESSLQDNASARCLATQVARHLTIPDSLGEEHCRFRYPIRLK